MLFYKITAFYEALAVAPSNDGYAVLGGLAPDFKAVFENAAKRDYLEVTSCLLDLWLKYPEHCFSMSDIVGVTIDCVRLCLKAPRDSELFKAGFTLMGTLNNTRDPRMHKFSELIASNRELIGSMDAEQAELLELTSPTYDQCLKIMGLLMSQPDIDPEVLTGIDPSMHKLVARSRAGCIERVRRLLPLISQAIEAKARESGDEDVYLAHIAFMKQVLIHFSFRPGLFDTYADGPAMVMEFGKLMQKQGVFVKDGMWSHVYFHASASFYMDECFLCEQHTPLRKAVLVFAQDCNRLQEELLESQNDKGLYWATMIIQKAKLFFESGELEKSVELYEKVYPGFPVKPPSLCRAYYRSQFDLMCSRLHQFPGNRLKDFDVLWELLIGSFFASRDVSPRFAVVCEYSQEEWGAFFMGLCDQLNEAGQEFVSRVFDCMYLYQVCQFEYASVRGAYQSADRLVLLEAVVRERGVSIGQDVSTFKGFADLGMLGTLVLDVIRDSDSLSGLLDYLDGNGLCTSRAFFNGFVCRYKPSQAPFISRVEEFSLVEAIYKAEKSSQVRADVVARFCAFSTFEFLWDLITDGLLPPSHEVVEELLACVTECSKEGQLQESFKPFVTLMKLQLKGVKSVGRVFRENSEKVLFDQGTMDLCSRYEPVFYGLYPRVKQFFRGQCLGSRLQVAQVFGFESKWLSGEWIALVKKGDLVQLDALTNWLERMSGVFGANDRRDVLAYLDRLLSPFNSVDTGTFSFGARCALARIGVVVANLMGTNDVSLTWLVEYSWGVVAVPEPVQCMDDPGAAMQARISLLELKIKLLHTFLSKDSMEFSKSICMKWEDLNTLCSYYQRLCSHRPIPLTLRVIIDSCRA